jgi:hypothetical protein
VSHYRQAPLIEPAQLGRRVGALSESWRAVRAGTEAQPDGDDSEVYSNRAAAYLMIDEVERAISAFERAHPARARQCNLVLQSPAFSRTTGGPEAINVSISNNSFALAIRLRPD